MSDQAWAVLFGARGWAPGWESSASHPGHPVHPVSILKEDRMTGFTGFQTTPDFALQLAEILASALSRPLKAFSGDSSLAPGWLWLDLSPLG